MDACPFFVSAWVACCTGFVGTYVDVYPCPCPPVPPPPSNSPQLLQKQQNKKEASLYSKMFKPSPTPAAPPAKESAAEGEQQPDATPAVDAAMITEAAPVAAEGQDAVAVSDQ